MSNVGCALSRLLFCSTGLGFIVYLMAYGLVTFIYHIYERALDFNIPQQNPDDGEIAGDFPQEQPPGSPPGAGLGFVKIGTAEYHKYQSAVPAKPTMFFPAFQHRDEKEQRNCDPKKTFDNIANPRNFHLSKIQPFATPAGTAASDAAISFNF